MTLCQNTPKTELPSPSGDWAEVVIRKPSRRHVVLMGSSEADRAKFRSMVSKEPNEKGCLEWLGNTNHKGYGELPIKGGAVAAHRMAYFVHHGTLDPNLLVCHHCDNPPCCNPEHLFMGTCKENVHDSVSKGRHTGMGLTHCVHGHKLPPPKAPNGPRRRCSICATRDRKKYNLKQKPISQ